MLLMKSLKIYKIISENYGIPHNCALFLNLVSFLDMKVIRNIKKQSNKKWLTSIQTKALLKISDCKLMHLRLEGKIEFKKDGRTFYYSIKN